MIQINTFFLKKYETIKWKYEKTRSNYVDPNYITRLCINVTPLQLKHWRKW